MIDKAEAERIAKNKISEMQDQSIDSIELMRGHEVNINEGWIFFYNTVEFINNNNPSAALAGNGPIFVDNSGKLQMLPSSIPWQQAIECLRNA